VGDVKIGVGIGFFGWRHRTLGPNRKGQFFVYFKKAGRKSACLDLLIGLLAFVVGKLWPSMKFVKPWR